MQSLSRFLSAFLACVLIAGATATRAVAQEGKGIARVTVECPHARQKDRLVAPGEWLPHSCGSAIGVPYRGGAVLRFERRERHMVVGIDGEPAQPACVYAGMPDGLDVLKRELDRGSRGFAVLCSPATLPSLPPLPAGRDIALTVSGSLTDLAPLRKHCGVAALCLYSKELTDLSPLAEFPDLTSLRLTHWEGVSDLRPLARLGKLTWLRLMSFPKVQDLSPLAEAPSLQGLELRWCKSVSDLSPLAGARHLRVLRIYGSEGISDVAPLAKLAKLNVLRLPGTAISDLGPLAALNQLVELDLSGCKNIADLRPLENLERLEQVDLSRCEGVKDLAPLRQMIRRGGKVTVPKELRPQLETLRDEAGS